MILDSKLSFQSHVREAIIKARKGIGIICFLSKYVSRDVLDQIYKLYVRPHLNYGDKIYHRHDPEFKLGTNTDTLYEELGWEILYYRRWYRRLCHFYKLRNNQRPLYLYSEIPQERTFHHNLRRANVYEANGKSTGRFSHTYFQNCMREWNQLDESIKISVLGQNPPGQNPPGQNPPDKIPLDKIPPRTKSPRTKSPWTKSPHYIPPNCSIAQYFLLYVNVIFEGQFSSTFVRCDIFHGHEVEKRS